MKNYANFPFITPYTLCEISKEKQPQPNFESHNKRHTVFRRILNPKKEPDQRTLPFIKTPILDVEEEEKKFKIFNFKRTKVDTYTTPDIPLISPQNANSSLLSNGVKHDLMFRPQK